MSNSWKIETNAVQAGYEPANGAPRVVPICQSTTYKYDDAQSVADLFDLKAPGHMYSRISNPTVEAFENKMAALEGGVAAVAASSGQTANTIAIMNCCPAGGHVIAASGLYGGTVNLFKFTLKKMGVDVTFVEPTATDDEIKANVRPNTRVIFAETLANPALKVLDFEKFGRLAKELGLPLIVDNTFPSPFLCRPFELGANIVTHSSTKYIDGHATSVGGVIIDGGNFDWTNGKFPEFTEPDVTYHGLIYTKDFKDAPFATKLRVQWIRDLGSYMSPMNAFLSHTGLETLHLRMERHSQNALRLAEFLEQHDKVSWVKYPGLKNDSEHELAKKYLPKGCSGVLCFGVKGGAKEGEAVMNSLKLAAIVVHVADVRTCVLHPASMTHRQLSEEALKAAGVSPDLIRVSVGIENIDDIIADFDQALNLI
ncbi:MAG: O-acetylhomoserine aminocarboxypropyltransferase/cysteine synthase [Lentisphaerae bacterium]|nr:O-acetylhomoserine aminocarboxypropyltransferase/cysteine synthase [Lentisphaerota bacterium]MCP4101057.1 O-acetylhomoserine aminocarboxypropyltransferase/cysteine synthase [Lentisphaerota bacterium]